MECPIWGTPAKSSQDSGDYIWANSQRAGGQLKVTGSVSHKVRSLDSPAKARLTTWLCNQRRAGVLVPEVNSVTLAEALERKTLPVTERMQRALLFFADHYRLGNELFVGDPGDVETDRFCAATESLSDTEANALLQLMDQAGLINYHDAFASPTALGWQRIEELTDSNTGASQAFVAMWFHDSTQAAYDEGIAPAIRQAGYDPMRIDRKEHNNKIDDEIIAEIRRSRFLVADFTCEPEKARGGVYFEAGFAMGLRIPVIWTCGAGSIGDLHFDTRQYAHIVWKTPEELRTQLTARISAVIGDGPLRTLPAPQ